MPPAIRIDSGEQCFSDGERGFRVRTAAEEPGSGQCIEDVTDPKAAGSVKPRDDVGLGDDRRLRRVMHLGLESL